MSGVLITRPHEDAGPLAAALRSLGFDPIVEPLMEIRLLDAVVPALEPFQGVLFTSANGVRAFARLTRDRTKPVYAVGDATASTAATAGFETVRSAGGTVEDLAQLVTTCCRPADGALLHAAGVSVSGDLRGLLAAAGFDVVRVTLYRAEPATRLADEVAKAMTDGRIGCVALFSPRTAAIFVRLAAAAGLESACHTLQLLCLSEAVAAVVRGSDLAFASIRIAARPTQNDLLQLLSSCQRSA